MHRGWFVGALDDRRGEQVSYHSFPAGFMEMGLVQCGQV